MRTGKHLITYKEVYNMIKCFDEFENIITMIPNTFKSKNRLEEKI